MTKSVGSGLEKKSTRSGLRPIWQTILTFVVLMLTKQISPVVLTVTMNSELTNDINIIDEETMGEIESKK